MQKVLIIPERGRTILEMEAWALAIQEAIVMLRAQEEVLVLSPEPQRDAMSILGSSLGLGPEEFEEMWKSPSGKLFLQVMAKAMQSLFTFEPYTPDPLGGRTLGAEAHGDHPLN